MGKAVRAKTNQFAVRRGGFTTEDTLIPKGMSYRTATAWSKENPSRLKA
jgi:hypothetical protein